MAIKKNIIIAFIAAIVGCKGKKEEPKIDVKEGAVSLNGKVNFEVTPGDLKRFTIGFDDKGNTETTFKGEHIFDEPPTGGKEFYLVKLTVDGKAYYDTVKYIKLSGPDTSGPKPEIVITPMELTVGESITCIDNTPGSNVAGKPETETHWVFMDDLSTQNGKKVTHKCNAVSSFKVKASYSGSKPLIKGEIIKEIKVKEKQGSQGGGGGGGGQQRPPVMDDNAFKSMLQTISNTKKCGESELARFKVFLCNNLNVEVIANNEKYNFQSYLSDIQVMKANINSVKQVLNKSGCVSQIIISQK